MQIRKFLIVWVIMLLLAKPEIVHAASHPTSADNQVTLDFPITATFSATLSADADIVSITLEYGDEQQTCGQVIAKAYPDFSPARTVDASWTWDMRQSGSLPPGATIWWRWVYTDSNGKEFSTEKQTIPWLDDVHDWKTLNSGDLRLHWYDSTTEFAKTMLDAGTEGLLRNERDAGLTTESPIDLYVYPNYDDMQEAVLYEPSWTGGMAFPEYNIFIMGISESDSDWDKNTVIHELTHILVGHFTFSCLGEVPTWLDEGLAMYSEGQLSETSQSQLEEAINSDSLLTIRSLNGGFSELPDKANLSYSQSYSIVNYLIATHGQEKMLDLLVALRDAQTIDAALTKIYGFDSGGLEDAWRSSIGAKPRSSTEKPALYPTPTFIPTYVPIAGVPIAGVPLAITPTPYSVSTSTPGNAETGDRNAFILLTMAIVCTCLVMLLILGVVILGLVVRTQNQKAFLRNKSEE